MGCRARVRTRGYITLTIITGYPLSGGGLAGLSAAYYLVKQVICLLGVKKRIMARTVIWRHTVNIYCAGNSKVWGGGGGNCLDLLLLRFV
jgi:hypothetical protein